MSRTVSPSPEKSSGVGSGVLVAVITGVAVGVGGKAFVEMIIGVSAGEFILGDAQPVRSNIQMQNTFIVFIMMFSSSHVRNVGYGQD